MKKDLWFKQKSYGYGWTPANWKGWVAAIAFLLLTVLHPVLAIFNVVKPSLPQMLLSIFVFTVGFIYLCVRKGEKPAWRWGDKDQAKKNIDQGKNS